MTTQLAPNVLSWATHIDQTTIDQAVALAGLPFIHPHIALMPDAHAGKGSAVGTVIPTEGAVIPAAVGVDIGCGMIAARTRYTEADLERIDLSELRDQVERAIPLSPGNYNSRVHHDHTHDRVAELEALAERNEVDLSHSPKWREQLGSLGGGNHFIELCLDETGAVWCFLHSGSRGVGNKIAQKHIKIAQALCKRWHIQLADRDHAYLPQGTPEFTRYLTELHWAQTFARLNRDEMMDRFLDQLARLFGDDDAGETERVNCHHNYTETVQVGGRKVWLTRKGAIDATEGRMGCIPGSMGTRSYIVRGKGNPSALFSAPHGAGRAMSRTQARKRFTAADLDEAMRGIVYRPGDEWVDEIPAAYKDIDQVMEDAADLVEVVHELRQVMNVKGT
ncbi:RtcB family protein [Dietzia cercidiphylli]|uniref:3'-phosphate/5'-hydroxy nucleic acid ligase n=1 Tax=Dietzia cercidiphylli TaxID=498199 RepID=A0ABN2JC77_9ACTN|nr:RtcB family protein [Dietzia cercidiphylli]